MKLILKENKRLFLFALLVVIACFTPYLVGNHGIMLQHGDMFELNLKLWQGGWQAVHDGTLSQYEWSLGLGANTLSYAFYFITNPFFWICCIFPKSFIPYSFLIIIMLEMWLGFIFSYCWLRKLTNHELGSTVGAFVVAFCAYSFFYVQVDQLLKLIFLYPLTLYFVEVWLKEGHWKGLVLTVALAAISNYYVVYQFIPFLVLYVVLRWIWLYKERAVHEEKLFLAALKFAGCMIFAAGLASLVLIPCASLVLSMPRFTTLDLSWSAHLDRWQIFRIITSIFIPTFEELDANAYILVDYVNSYGWCGGVPLYSLILSPLLLPFIFFFKNKHEKRFFLIFGLFLVVFCLFYNFYYLFQLSLDCRWFYMFSFFCAMAVASVIKEFSNSTKTNRIWFAGIGLLVVMWGCFGFSWMRELNFQEKLLLLAKVLLFLSVLVIGYCYLIAKKKPKQYWIILCSIEAIFSGVFFCSINTPIPYTVYQDEVLTTSVGEYLIANDPGFYRVQYNDKKVTLANGKELSLMTGNEPYANDYNGFGFYESVYNTNQEEFLWRLKSSWNMTQMLGRSRTYDMLSSKYWYTFDYSDPIPFGYSLVFTSEEGYSLYQNNNYIELGYSYEKTINKDYLLEQSFLDQDRLMLDYLVTETSTNTEVQLNDSIIHLATLPAVQIRTYTFEEPVKDVILYVQNYGMPEVTIRLLLQGEEIASYHAWQFNYVDVPVYETIDEIVIDAPEVYTSQTEIDLSMEIMDGTYEEHWAQVTQEHFTDVVFQGDTITGNITTKGSDKYIFTSIPYDAGWTVQVDGKPVLYEKVQMGFIGFVVEPGQHTVTFTYEMPNLKTGLIVSGLSLLILIGLILYKRRP